MVAMADDDMEDSNSSSSCGSSACCHDEKEMDEDNDGCSSYVEGDRCSSS
jgi:hypothetical protein